MQPEVKPGQVYDWPAHPEYGKLIVDYLVEHIGRPNAPKMWTFVGNGLPTTNIDFFVAKGKMRLYSQNSLNA